MICKKILKEKGEMDYDYKQDILFFKAKGREYAKSIELDNIVIDIDSKGFITGIQIFEASKFLGLEKKDLMKIPKWNFTVNVGEGKIEIRLVFQIQARNKIIEKNPIIIQTIKEQLPSSELTCTAV